MKLAVLIALLLPFTMRAQSDILGQWKTLDDDTGLETSIVELFEKNNRIYGKIIKIFPGPSDQKDPVCNKCDADDPRYGKKVVGMEILQDLKKDGGVYSGGTVLDPKNGQVYRCKIWREAGNLMIRGYLGPFYRTQTWKKAR